MEKDILIQTIIRFRQGRTMTVLAKKMRFEPFNWKLLYTSCYIMENLIVIFKLDSTIKNDYDRLSNICDKLNIYIE